MVALTHPDSVDAGLERLADFGIDSWVAGEIDVDPDQSGTVRLVGQHTGW
jgi:phosphoribosylformylglycinamidine cyclo-ligase